MTRINVIPVEELADQHLMAEYRELPMVNASLRRSFASKRGFDKNRIPKEYTLNSGHVTFFYDKGLFLLNRYNDLITELRRREYKVDPDSRTVDWTVFKQGYWNDWTPTIRNQFINVERIVIRLQEKPTFYNYNKIKVNETFALNLKEKYIGLLQH